VRYRMVSVTGEGSVEDVISRWTDSAYTLPSGRIQGQAWMVKAAVHPEPADRRRRAQTLTAADGSFMIEGLPPGVHNLVAIAMDGSYQTFQQGARVAEGSTTMAALTMNAASFVNWSSWSSPQAHPSGRAAAHGWQPASIWKHIRNLAAG